MLYAALDDANINIKTYDTQRLVMIFNSLRARMTFTVIRSILNVRGHGTYVFFSDKF